MTRRLLPKLVLSLALAALFVLLYQRQGVPLVPPREAFGGVRWWTVPAYALTLLATHFVRASRWRFLIAPVKKDIPFWEAILINWVGFFAIFALPLRLGEMARPALTKMRHGVSISVGLGTVAVERVIDGLVTSLCVVWALVAIPHLPATDDITRSLPVLGTMAVAAFGGAFFGLALFLWQRSLAIWLIDATFGRVSARLGGWVAGKVADVAEGVRVLAEPRLALGFLGETLLYWGLNAAGMWLLGWGVGLDLTFGHAVGIMGILAIGILLPAGPGRFGNFQFAVGLARSLYFGASVVGTDGAVYVFLLYGVQLVLITLAGVIPLYAMNLSFADLLRAPKDERSSLS
ncbi:MAG: lysylphosphatidylglycerol synthase transmembrane domain-containing protein [Sandaracinaceae bacterium]